MRKRRQPKSGFSLAEILVAIAIIAVVAAILIPSIGGQLRSGDESRIQQDFISLRTGAEQSLRGGNAGPGVPRGVAPTEGSE